MPPRQQPKLIELSKLKIKRLSSTSTIILDRVLLNEAVISKIIELLQSNMLVSLTITNTNIELSTITLIVEALKQNTSLKTLDLSKNNLNSNKIIILLVALTTNKNITNVNISNNLFDYYIEKYLYELILHNDTITTLDVSYSELEDSTAINIQLAIKDNRTLEHFMCNNCKFTPLGQYAILNAISYNNTIKSFNVKQADKYTFELFTTLCNIWKRNHQITNVDISSYVFRRTALQSFIAVLDNNKSITNLNLSNLEQELHSSFIPLVHMISRITSDNLTVLNLNSNRRFFVNPGASESIAQFLSTNTSLKELDISYNNISDNAPYIMKALTTNNNTLLNLNISVNNITDLSTQSIIDMIKTNTTLLTLNLQLNKFESVPIRNAIEHNKTIINFDLLYSNNNYDNFLLTQSYLLRNRELRNNQFWNPTVYNNFPKSFDEIAVTALLCNKNLKNTKLPNNLFPYILSFCKRKALT